MARVYKVELMIVDHEDCGEDEVITLLESVKYLYPLVVDIDSVPIEWDDEHPLNHRDTWRQEFNQMFS